MSLLSLLIAPLHAVVLFFAPHIGTPSLNGLKASNARLPSQPWRVAHGAPSGSETGSQTRRTPGASANAGANAGALSATRMSYPQRTNTAVAQPIHRVRVVRNLDSTLPADRAGRMVVSGRFADVCAELDRMIALQMRTV